MLFRSLLSAVLACSLPVSGPSNATPISVGETPVSVVSSPGGGGSVACNNPLYPVVAGASWIYSFNGTSPGNFTRSITAVNADGFSDQDVFTSGITRAGEWKCNAGTLTALKPGGDSTATVQSNNIDSTFTTTAMDGVTLPASINAGDSWAQNFTIEGTETVNGKSVVSKSQIAYSCMAGGSESVTVPAGTFDAVRVECKLHITITITMNGAEIPATTDATSTTWYALGVGMVKTDSVVSDIGNSTIELTAYNIP